MAFLIRERIKSECDFFLKNWGGPMDVYIELASGSANVGFYGHKKIMQSYTALGPPVNLAARLCSDAERNEILISAEIAELVMNNDDFSVVSRGRIKLHGFEEEVYFYRVEKVNIKINESHVGNDFSICEKCSGRLTLLERKSVWYYRCNSCEVEF
jgi:class 3 adenylate cyclase